MRLRSVMVFICLVAASLMMKEAVSSTFAERISGQGKVQLTGWVELKGELLIYRDPQSMDRDSKFPDCVSGVFRNQAEMRLSEYDGRFLSVTGTLYKYADLPYEQRPLAPRRVLAASVIPNWCFGTNVLLIEKIKLISDSHKPKT